MKLLIMCEGPNELEIINLLLDAEAFNFSRDDLVNLSPYHARQLSSPIISTALGIYPGEFKVLRIGDKLNEKLKIPKEYAHRCKGIEKYCTKPEIEMLIIIAEGRLRDFEKTKSSVTPKSYCKANVKFNRRKYDNSTSFYTEYFGNDITKLIDSLKKYKQSHGAHTKDELYLADRIK